MLWCHVADFERSLAENPAPQALGDVALRYEPSMLIGQTNRRASLRPTALATLGAALAIAGLGTLLMPGPSWPAAGLLVLSALAFSASVRLRRRERQQRTFVLNFASASLRLDEESAVLGSPQTVLVAFDQVQQVSALIQSDGLHCLTVDLSVASRARREVMVAHVPEAQLLALERFRRVLEGAFGLGAVPPDSPYRSTQGEGRPPDEQATPAAVEHPGAGSSKN